MSMPRYRSDPPSRSGSAISVSTATTPSSPGLKSLIRAQSTRLNAVEAPVESGADGASRDVDPGRRHGARADGGDAPGARGDGRRVRLGRPAGRHRRDGAVRREPAAGARARLDPP